MLVFLTLGAMAQNAVDPGHRSRDVAHDAIDFACWRTSRTVQYETAPGVRSPFENAKTGGDETLECVWAKPTVANHFDLLVQTLNNADLYMAPKSEWTLRYRPVRTRNEPNCDLETCSAIEIYPVHAKLKSPLDLDLGLAAGALTYADIKKAYVALTGRRLEVMSNGRVFPQGIPMSDGTTLRTYLNEVCSERCSWSYINHAVVPDAESYPDTIVVQPRGSQWASGKAEAQRLQRTSGMTFPGADESVPVIRPEHIPSDRPVSFD